MKMNHPNLFIRFLILGFFFFPLMLSGCSSFSKPDPAEQAALPLDQTSATEFVINNFASVHTADGEDANKFMIFGNLPIADPAPDLPAELAVFLGRWEGFSYTPPVLKDRKLVLSITEINQQGGIAYGWSGTNLQYPDFVKEIHFRVVNHQPPTLEWKITSSDHTSVVAVFYYDKAQDKMIGSISDKSGFNSDGPYELTREESFFVYQDYAQYLESKRITVHDYEDSQLQTYGKGYMLYLPEGYETDTTKHWPLLFFLHGYGDRGTNPLVLAKASPFMFIREKGALPFIIAAPLLNADEYNYTFPNEYMDGVMDELLANYRVDDQRVYLTGLSMGGEGTWKFALHRPDLFAAAAPLCGYFAPAEKETMQTIKDLPVWAIHGEDDTVVPLEEGKAPVEGLQEAGGNVKFTILPGHNHDVWTDTYSDPAFYDWLLQYQKP